MSCAKIKSIYFYGGKEGAAKCKQSVSSERQAVISDQKTNGMGGKG